MRILYAVAMAGLLVAGLVEANKKIVSGPKPVAPELCRKDLSYPSKDQVKRLNESLRLALNHICSLACAGFEHRNITPSELYYYLQKHLENYKKISDEMENFCKINKIEPCCIYLEKNPGELVNILEGFRVAHQPEPELLELDGFTRVEK